MTCAHACHAWISIHASRGGSDRTALQGNEKVDLFQSTLPAGEATHGWLKALLLINISIHASRGGSDPISIAFWVGILQISIHASRGGSDGSYGEIHRKTAISIHASRGGSDLRHHIKKR